MAIAFKVQTERFPKAFGFLASTLPVLPGNQASLWKAFKQFANLTEDEAVRAVVFNGQSPLIFGSNLGSATWGQFDPTVPQRIEIGIDVLDHFENDHNNTDAQKFLLAKVLHELCHWGCFRKQAPDNDEAGEQFELAVFNQELQPWWSPSAASVPTAAPMAGDVFTDPSARAAECRRLRELGRHLPGRMEDPQRRVFGGIDAAESLPRGYRNNNPGNIRKSGDAWLGLADPALKKSFQLSEGSFAVFMEPEWGIRAMAVLLRTYKNTHGLRTPRSIIARWAPEHDNNDVASYSSALAAALNVDRDAVIDVDDDGMAINTIKAMARHENGIKVPYSDVQFEAAMLLAR